MMKRLASRLGVERQRAWSHPHTQLRSECGPKLETLKEKGRIQRPRTVDRACTSSVLRAADLVLPAASWYLEISAPVVLLLLLRATVREPRDFWL